MLAENFLTQLLYKYTGQFFLQGLILDLQKTFIPATWGVYILYVLNIHKTLIVRTISKLSIAMLFLFAVASHTPLLSDL